MSNLNICVLGAGVNGLTTAIELKRELRNARVSVLADQFTTETVSHVAAVLFRPGTSFCGPDLDTTLKWIHDAYNYWADMTKSPEGETAGVKELSGYMFSTTSPKLVRNHLIEKILPLYRMCTEEELNSHPGGWKYGAFFTTVLTDCGLYLPWAAKKFESMGGEIKTQKIESFSEISSNFDMVVNCTGLRAKWLCYDHKLVPIRGQVRKVHAPWLKHFYYGEYDSSYIIPGFRAVTMGGCRNYDSWDMAVNPYDTIQIREKCESLVPKLKEAPVIEDVVGLRPHRDPVRVEKEILNCADRKIKIVHNYGHGGYGVMTSPGTGLYAIKLMKELWAGNSKM